MSLKKYSQRSWKNYEIKNLNWKGIVMNVFKAIERIKTLSLKMEKALEEDRAIIYAAIKTLINELTAIINENKKNGYLYVEEKLGELDWHAQSLAHLDDGNGHSDEQHYLWLLRELNTIEKNAESI